MDVLVIPIIRVLKAVDFSAASIASASASDCRYFTSSYPTHQIRRALPLPKPCLDVKCVLALCHVLVWFKVLSAVWLNLNRYIMFLRKWN